MKRPTIDPDVPIGFRSLLGRAESDAVVVLMGEPHPGGATVGTGGGDCWTAALFAHIEGVGVLAREGDAGGYDRLVVGVVCRSRSARAAAIGCALTRGGVAEVRPNAKPDRVIASSRTEKPTGFKPLTRASALDAIGDVLELGDAERVAGVGYRPSSFMDAVRHSAVVNRERKRVHRAAST